MYLRRTRKSGFTLVEAVIASALLSLLVAASYIAVSQTMYSARLTAQRVTAQGMCLALLEDMRALPFDTIFPSDADLLTDCASMFVQDRKLFMESQGLGPGTSNVSISYNTNENVSVTCEFPHRYITISCSWDFARPWQNGAAVRHEETLEGMVFDLKPRSSSNTPLNIDNIALNPNYDAATQTFTMPQYLRIVDETGAIYTQSDLLADNIPSSLRAVSVVVTPGGTGQQNNIEVLEDVKVKNAKRYGFYSNGMTSAAMITVQIKQSGGKYFMNLYCDDASVSIQ